MFKVAIVGKPNVGKSSLFNRIIKQQDAITSSQAGTTRDVKIRDTVLEEGREITLIDTGGLEQRSSLFAKVKEKALQIAKEADLVLFMVDGQKYPDDEEITYFRNLLKMNKEIWLVVNKIDNDKLNEMVYEYYQLGATKIFPLSVTHNRGVSKLLKAISNLVPPTPNAPILTGDEDMSLEEFLSDEEEYQEPKEIKVSIIGKVNVGKSSLLNALIQEERSIVSDVDGTTIDPIDERLVYKDKLITFVDTAGIRRRSKIKDIEKYALLRTQKNLENTDIALLVIDAKNGIAELDERIAGLIDKYQTGAIIVMNKWDENQKEYQKFVDEVRLRFKFLYFAPIIAVSAKSGRNIEKLKEMILYVFKNYSQRIPTATLNDVIKEATTRHYLPTDKTKPVKILFATQYKTKPPTIALVMNRVHLHFSYKRYLINYLRSKFDFTGSPIILTARKRGQKDEIIE
ncbi:MAG: ribosome biogenesis GTPase Der [Epsilonproteobacteria bacterium]|nr:ribosome biogenesis GTPase Der [Campylobacterota bacterium]